MRSRLATMEYDELPDGSSEPGTIEWVDYRKVEELPLFPVIGSAVNALSAPDTPAGNPYLPPITDANYTWR
ncbi:hypothetical protein AB0L44_42150 [Nonomuraea wenchangensis]|uniref:hypothetical protein n=1 Tax=Nonomuraea wenchangensis TaxID=568860 RepID=UPI00342A6662